MLMRWSRPMPRPATEWRHLSPYINRLRALPSFIEVNANNATLARGIAHAVFGAELVELRFKSGIELQVGRRQRIG